MKSVALIGGAGYVGRGLQTALRARDDVQLTVVTRDSYDAHRGGRYDVVINAAMPAARYRARQEPEWDFAETVVKTARLLYSWNADKLVQVSSISARSQLDTVYGRHKAAAERLCRPATDLIVRLGAMYSDDLEKGVLRDLLAGRTVFVDATSRYCFAPRDWIAGWVAANLDRTGIVEVGARDSLALADVASHLAAPVEFRGPVDHQEVEAPDATFPAAADVLSWLDEQHVRPAAGSAA